jgi:carbamoyl-phosphate synthase small subunit
MTYPLIGNYGVPGDLAENGLARWFESDRIQVSGLVVSEHSGLFSHWNSVRTLSAWMAEHSVPGLSGIDTRALTKHIRERGSMPGKLVFSGDLDFRLRSAGSLVAEVSVKEPVCYGSGQKRVAVVDCGVKNSIIRAFLRRGIAVTRYPWDADFLEGAPDGVVISNGPGDPRDCPATIKRVSEALEGRVPILGICLGSQILGLAAGASTYKLKFGHRGHNQPCSEAGTRRCYITSQNHGYAVDASTLPRDWREWFVNANDGTNEGIHHISKPFFGTQFHPEASPGPDDTEMIFDMFVRALP